MGKKNTENEKLNPGKIDRRDFIRKSAMVCCMANIPLAAGGLSLAKNDNAPTAGPKVNPLELATYCGLYCGACDIYQKRISKAGNELKKILTAMDFNEWAPQVPGLEDYAAFDKVLNNIITMFGECPGCMKGGGDPQCKVRLCAKEKGYKTCAECPEVPCGNFKQLMEGYPQIVDELKEIKSVGLEKWCQKQQEKVDKGYRYSEALGK